MSNDYLVNQLKVLTESLLNNHKLREGILYKYMPFNVFVKMCESAYKKINQEIKEDEIENNQKQSGFLDLFCFDAETYNDPREGKLLIELSEENECTNGNIGLLAQLYRDTEINKNLVDINTIVFVGSFVFEQKERINGIDTVKNKVSHETGEYSDNISVSIGDFLCGGITLTREEGSLCR